MSVNFLNVFGINFCFATFKVEWAQLYAEDIRFSHNLRDQGKMSHFQCFDYSVSCEVLKVRTVLLKYWWKLHWRPF